MQQVDNVSSYAWEDRPRIHVVQSLMNYSCVNSHDFSVGDSTDKTYDISLIYCICNIKGT